MTSAQAPFSVLIADPDPKVRELVKICLKKIAPSCRILEANNTIETKGVLSSFAIEMLIADVNLPGGGGMQIYQKLSELSSQSPPHHVLLLSELIDRDSQSQDLDAALIFLSKPLDPAKIIELLKKKTTAFQLPASEKATLPPTTHVGKVDVRFFNAFGEGVIHFFSRAAKMTLKKDRLRLRKDSPLSGEIAGSMSFSIPDLEGKLIIAMNKSSFLGFNNAFLGSQDTEITKDNSDAILELCNQVYGFAKMTLNEYGFCFDLVLPKLHQGADSIFPPPEKGQVFTLFEFEAPFGRFQMEIQILKINRDARPPTS
ncbi:response regulator [Bdellovibrionota bacterium FG-2]